MFYAIRNVHPSISSHTLEGGPHWYHQRFEAKSLHPVLPAPYELRRDPYYRDSLHRRKKYPCSQCRWINHVNLSSWENNWISETVVFKPIPKRKFVWHHSTAHDLLIRTSLARHYGWGSPIHLWICQVFSWPFGCSYWKTHLYYLETDLRRCIPCLSFPPYSLSSCQMTLILRACSWRSGSPMFSFSSVWDCSSIIISSRRMSVKRYYPSILFYSTLTF